MVRRIADRIAVGAGWMVAARFIDRAIGLVSTVILARLLTPNDFGLVAMAMAVIMLIEIASAFGFEVAIVRAQRPTRELYDTVWTLRALTEGGCGAAIAAASWATAAFYGDPRLVGVMIVLGAAWALRGLTNIGIVDFQRDLDFGKEFRFLMTRRLVGFATTLPFALLTHSYWALIAGTVAGHLAAVTISYVWHPYRPRVCLRAVREVFSFSAWIFVDKLAHFGNTRAADFVLGRTHGASELAYFRLGDEIGHLPGTELAAPLNRALLPGLAQVAKSGESLRQLVLGASGVVAVLIVPACLGIHAVADPLVRVMLGAQWLPVIPVVKWMALNSLFLAFWANQHMSLLAIGRARLPAVMTIVRFCILAPSVLVLAPEFGASGVAMAAALSSMIELVLGLSLSLATFGLQLRVYLRAIWRPIVAALAMWYLVSTLAANIAAVLTAPAAQLVALVCAGALTYSIVLAGLYVAAGRPAGAERLLLKRAQLVLRRDR